VLEARVKVTLRAVLAHSHGKSKQSGWVTSWPSLISLRCHRDQPAHQAAPDGPHDLAESQPEREHLGADRARQRPGRGAAAQRRQGDRQLLGRAEEVPGGEAHHLELVRQGGREEATSASQAHEAAEEDRQGFGRQGQEAVGLACT